MFSSKDLFFTPAVSTGYTVSKSLRFRSSASAYLNRTIGTPTGSTTWTWSAWVKRGSITSSAYQYLFSYDGTASRGLAIASSADTYPDAIYVYNGSTQTYGTTPVRLRDPSAWYHILVSCSSGTASVYINGNSTAILSASSMPAMSNGMAMNIGRLSNGGSAYFDGYMAEVNFIDGSAKATTDFGAYDTNGIWQPAAYTGSYGTNGYYLKFTDVGATSGSNTGYGKDFAGTNYFTTNNFGTTSTATTYDSMLDSPTNAAGDIGNYCIINPLSQRNSSTVANGNLTGTLTAYSGAPNLYGSQSVSSGKYYWEITYTSRSGNNALAIGIVNNNAGMPLVDMASGSAGVWYYSTTGDKRVNGSATAYGLTYDTGDVIGVALDVDTPQITFYKNNASQGAFSIPSSGTWTPGCWNGTSSGNQVFDANFGQRPFAYTPPSGYSALNTQNLPTPTITNGASYMAAVTYTGNSSSTGNVRSITTTSSNSGNNPNGTTFQPDFVWIKNRSNAYRHSLYDAVRGTGSTKNISSSSVDIEGTDANLYGYVSAYNSDGFQVTNGTDASFAGIWVNQNTQTFVGWQWNAGGSTVTNTSGSISSQVRANTTAGFSVVTWSGAGSTGTIGHGLGVAPNFIILKRRNAAVNWYVGGSNVATAGNGTWSSVMEGLNTTQAVNTAATAVFNSTAPTSTVFTGGTELTTNGGTYVAYCFAAIASYSSFGVYTGNGLADGPMVYLGFRPRWILIKRASTFTSGYGDWYLYDTSRMPYNVTNTPLYPNTGGAESTANTAFNIDILSNGFKVLTTYQDLNLSGTVYIYAAFAENPFKINRAR